MQQRPRGLQIRIQKMQQRPRGMRIKTWSSQAREGEGEGEANVINLKLRIKPVKGVMNEFFLFFSMLPFATWINVITHI